MPGGEIKEFYDSYTPPGYALKTVRALLASVPEKYLRGLGCIVLTNHAGRPRNHRLGKTKSRKRRIALTDVLGLYHPAYHGRRAWIELYVDKIANRIEQYETMPGVECAAFAEVLFHELGHHIHYVIAPDRREKEDVADEWQKKLLDNLVQKALGLRNEIDDRTRVTANGIAVTD